MEKKNKRNFIVAEFKVINSINYPFIRVGRFIVAFSSKNTRSSDR